MSALHPVLVVLLVAAAAMAAVWWLQVRTSNAGYVDVAWALLMGCAAIWYAVVGDGAPVPRVATGALGALWGFRLGLHLLHRVSREPEDGRYRFLRARWNGHQGKFFAFFMAQAGFTVLLSLPFFIASRNPVPGFTGWIAAGIAIWAVAVAGESTADVQLARFRSVASNTGKTCRAGLWRYSRHPNYFFEWLHGFAYVAFSVGAPQWWLSFLGPALMLLFLYRLTGIPFVEAQALRSRGDDYRRYQQETSAFLPWRPLPASTVGAQGDG